MFSAGHCTEGSAYMVMIQSRKVRSCYERINIVFVDGCISKFQQTDTESSYRTANVEAFQVFSMNCWKRISTCLS